MWVNLQSIDLTLYLFWSDKVLWEPQFKIIKMYIQVKREQIKWYEAIALWHTLHLSFAMYYEIIFCLPNLCEF